MLKKALAYVKDVLIVTCGSWSLF